VLGGYGNLSAIDIPASFRFIFAFFKAHPEHNRDRVIDCGAGVGRIAKELLCQVYKRVDIIDQCSKYVEKAKEVLSGKNIGHFYAKGLQEFTFEEKYDCVWIQWVISHLTESDAERFLISAKASLNPHGIIVLKENHAMEEFVVDKQDYSVTRTRNIFLKLFEKAGLQIVQEEMQPNWPKELLQVRMYILQ
jgi:protein N-terminal methyltransferase